MLAAKHNELEAVDLLLVNGADRYTLNIHPYVES